MTAKKKSSAKVAKKATKAAPAIKKIGVIATLIEMMQRPSGASVDAMVAALTKKFPDRKPAGLAATTRVQTSRQGARKEVSTDGVRWFLKA